MGTILHISIHAPRVGSDLPVPFQLSSNCIFQSTLPVWGATHSSVSQPSLVIISIHAPRVGSDIVDMIWVTIVPMHFNPRSPCGERPLGIRYSTYPLSDFNPRSPCGERHDALGWKPRQPTFQSTLPVWGATKLHKYLIRYWHISIHAPRVGSDCSFCNFFDRGLTISIHAPRVGSDELISELARTI